MGGNYEKGMYNQLMDVMTRLDSVEKIIRGTSDGWLCWFQRINSIRSRAVKGKQRSPLH